MRHKALILSLLAVMAGGLSCDSATRPLTTGSIAIHLLTPDGQAALIGAPAPGLSADAAVVEGGGGLANVTLTGVRVTVAGPTAKTVTSTTPTAGNFEITVSDLDVGTYTVTVEGLVNNQVSNYGQTGSVSVTAGNTTAAGVTFQSFRPAIPASTVVDTSDVLHFTVSWGTVTGATSYIVAWSLNSDMSGAQTKTVTTTTTDVQVTSEGKYFVTVQAVNNVVTAGGLPSPTKGVYVFQGVATVAVTPATPSIAYGATQQFAAEARDADNNVVANVTWFWASSNHTVATVSQTGLVTSVGTGSVTITAVAKGTPGNATLTVSPPPPSRLAFTAQPANATSNQSLGSVKVSIQNSLGQTATTDNATQIQITIGTNAGSGTLGGTAIATVAAGVATFNNLSIDKAGAGYTLSAAPLTGSLTSATSSPFNVTPGAGTQLAFSVQPANAIQGDMISPAVQVEIRDAAGNVATGNRDAVTISIGNNAGSATLSGAKVVNAIGGIASFTSLSLSKAGSGYTLAASATGLSGATSAAFDITSSGAATQLAFTAQPSGVAAGSAITPGVQVSLLDAAGRVVTGDNSTQVTIAIGTNPGSSTLGGTATAIASAGVATFGNLTLNKTGDGYTLGASATSLTSATSTAFDVRAGAPTQLAVTVQPANSVAGDQISPAVQVEIRDANGNRVTSNRDPVTVAIGTNPGAGTLTGTKTVNAIDGIASFTGLWINKSGTGYTLAASASGLTGATSGTFNVVAGAPAKLAFATQPSNTPGNALMPAVTVQIADQYDNPVTTATNNVTVGIFDNPWKSVFSQGSTLSGTRTVAAVGGVATFNTLRVDKPSPGYTLGATSGTLTTGVSSSFNVNLAFTSIFSAPQSAHTCGITANGAYCFGNNGNGQLGVPVAVGYQDSIAALVRTGLTFVTMAVGSNHTCGLTAAGAAYCWGYNGNGQLGNNSTSDSDVPVLVAGGHTFVAIAAGNSHTCAVTGVGAGAENRQVYCWGYNGTYQLGDSTNTQRTTPVKVKWPDAFKAAGAGTADTITLSTVTAGYGHTCVVARDQGKGFCWGYDYYGQTGDGAVVPGAAVRQGPIQINTGSVTGWTSLSAGYIHTCGIASAPVAAAGKPYCWGYDGYGQLGNGDNTFTVRSVPQQASNTGGWTAIAAGNYHSCALLNGAAYCWGYPYNGQLGNDNSNDPQISPVTVSGGITTFSAITAGGDHTCARTNTGAVYCWGYNGNGQLGQPGTGTVKKTPSQIVQ